MGSVGHDDVVHAKPPASVNSARLAAYELASMAAVPSIALALAKLNIFEALAQAGDDAQLTGPELAAIALPGKSVNLNCLERLLRMMCAKKVLREVVTGGQGAAGTERRFALEPLGRLLVDDSENGSYLYLLHLMHHPSHWEPMEHIHESILNDAIAPNSRANGVVSGWDYYKENPERGEVMNKAMVGVSKATVPSLLEAYHGFDKVKVLVDVGGGSGALLGCITAQYPHIKAINFDQPQVIAAAPQWPGVEHVGGDMFDSIPSGGDAIIMKFILHGWEDENCVKILKRCYEALPALGKVISIEHLLPEIIDFEGGDPVALQADIHMLAWSTNGCERTESDMRKLGLAAGFKQLNLICKVDAMGVFEFHKA